MNEINKKFNLLIKSWLIIDDPKLNQSEKSNKIKQLFKQYSEIYCKIHKIKLIHNKKIINCKTIIEIGYCSKCNKEYCEYTDISPVYCSNFEWLYTELN